MVLREFEQRLNRALPLSDAHRFAGIHRTDDGRWYGSCLCGHTDIPTSSKEFAWQGIVDHFALQIKVLQLREAMRRDPDLLDAWERSITEVADAIASWDPR